MAVTRFRDWRISNKIMFLSSLGIFFLLGGLFVHLPPFIEGKVMQERLATVRDIVEFATGVLDQKEALVRSGRLTRGQAQKEAAEEISKLRYGGNSEYVWINDLDRPVPHMVMHPTMPELNGRLMNDPSFNRAVSLGDRLGRSWRESDRKNLFLAFNEAAQAGGEGVVRYSWPKPLQGGGVTGEPFPKISYVKGFAPWGWVLGSGLYVDDVQTDAELIRRCVLAVSLALAGLLLVLSLLNGRRTGIREAAAGTRLPRAGAPAVPVVSGNGARHLGGAGTKLPPLAAVSGAEKSVTQLPDCGDHIGQILGNIEVFADLTSLRELSAAAEETVLRNSASRSWDKRYLPVARKPKSC